MGDALTDLWTELARELGLDQEGARALGSLISALRRGPLSYEEALEATGLGDEGDDVILLAVELGLAVPTRPDARCLEWDAAPLGQDTLLSLNPAVKSILEALERGESPLSGLRRLFLELGLEEDEAEAIARVSLELSARPFVSGSDVASACRSHGLSGLESFAVAILKAAGIISPVLSSSWPSGDVRYRTCRALWLLTGQEGRVIKA